MKLFQQLTRQFYYLQNPQDFIKRRPVKPIPSPEQESCLAEFRDFLSGEETIFVLSGTAGSGKSYLIPLFEELALASGTAEGLVD